MKKIVLIAAISAIAFSSCRQEEQNPIAKGGELTLKISSDMTKTTTAMQGGSWVPFWTEGDKIGVYVNKDGEPAFSNLASDEVQSRCETHQFTVNGLAASEEDQTLELYAYYPYTEQAAEADYHGIKVNVPSVQYPAEGAYDPKAEVLSGYPAEVLVEAGSLSASASVKFARKTSVLRFTTSYEAGLFDGITANTCFTEVSVTFDKAVAGEGTFSVTDSADIALAAAGSSKTVVLRYEEGEHKLSDDLWLSIAPVSGVHSITFDFKVGEGQYLHGEATIPGEGAAFQAGEQNKISLPIFASGNWNLKEYKTGYTKLTSLPEKFDGKYIIVSGTNVFTCTTGSRNWGGRYAVTAGDAIAALDTLKSFEVEFVPCTDSTYKVMVPSGKYLRTNTGNFAEPNDVGGEIIPVLKDDGVQLATSGHANILAHNNGANYGFRWYSYSNQLEPAYLYKYASEAIDIQPVFGQANVREVACDEADTVCFSIPVSCLGRNTVEVKSVDSTVVKSAEVYLLAEGIATISFEVNANEGSAREGFITLKAGQTEKTVTVSQASPANIVTIESVEPVTVEGEASTECTFEVVITNKQASDEITFGLDACDFVYDPTAALKSGSTYTVTFCVPEHRDSTYYVRKDTLVVCCGTASTEVVISQKEYFPAITVEEFIEKADVAYAYQLTGTVVSEVKNKSFDICDGTDTIYVYKIDNISTFSQGDIVTLHGKYQLYKEKHEVVSPVYESHVVAPKLSVSTTALSIGFDETSAAFDIVASEDAYWTVSSSNPAVSVSPASGNGNAKVTLSVAENETKEDVTSTITVSSTTENVHTAHHEISFTQLAVPDGNEKTYTIEGTFDYVDGEGDKKELQLTQHGITIIQKKNNSGTSINNIYNTATNLRLYASHSLTISSSCVIKKIEIPALSGYASTLSANCGVYSTSTNTWTGTSNSVVLTNTSSSQFRPSSIKVTIIVNESTITTTDCTINTNGSVDLVDMFSSNSNGEFTYKVTTNPDGAGYIEDGEFKASKPGEYIITGTQSAWGDYDETDATAKVTVTEPVWTLKSIAVTTPPTKTSYEAGDFFNPAGMVVTAYWQDETNFNREEVITDYTYPTEALEAGTESVQIEYEGQSTSVEISVTASTTTWETTGIAVTAQPTKTEYSVGEELDLSGIVVTATQWDANDHSVTRDQDVTALCNFDPENGTVLETAGEQTINISLKEDASITCSTTVQVKIEAIVFDASKKTAGHAAYNDSWTYGDWKITYGANNNKGWGYFKMGGRNTTISTCNPCTIAYSKEIKSEASKITVHIVAGSFAKTGMSVNSWGIYVYSDAAMTTQVDYVAGGTITNSEGTFTFTPTAGKTWKDCYVKVSWDLANTSGTNGIICVDKVTIDF